jgi:hypothetical protein
MINSLNIRYLKQKSISAPAKPGLQNAYFTGSGITFSIIFITLKNKKKLSVYPTLTNGSFTIRNADDIFLYNSRGVFIKRLYKGLNNIGDLPNGLYILRSSETSVKIIKQ